MTSSSGFEFCTLLIARRNFWVIPDGYRHHADGMLASDELHPRVGERHIGLTRLRAEALRDKLPRDFLSTEPLGGLGDVEDQPVVGPADAITVVHRGKRADRHARSTRRRGARLHEDAHRD